MKFTCSLFRLFACTSAALAKEMHEHKKRLLAVWVMCLGFCLVATANGLADRRDTSRWR